MRIKTIVDEDFTNYKKTAMFVGTVSCGGKCCHEANIPITVCQNDGWRANAPIAMGDEAIFKRYIENPLTKAIVFGGLEPFEQFPELLDFIQYMRFAQKCNDDIVIYTGYYREEIEPMIDSLSHFENIIVKFGRYIPDDVPRFDTVLGILLSSGNQYAQIIHKKEKRKVKIRLNPDKEYVEQMRKALKENDGYCPCLTEKTEDTKCMCKAFREQESGLCHCGLYIKDFEELEGQMKLDGV